MPAHFFTEALGLDRAAADLAFWQVALRAVVVFASGAVIVRVADKRFFAKKSAFDVLMIFIVGSILGRAINGSEKLFSTIGACFLLVGMHRLLGTLACRWPRFECLIKGHANLIVRDGRPFDETLLAHHLSRADVMEDLRLKTSASELAEVDEARLERSGDISFKLKQPPRKDIPGLQ